MSVLLLIQDVPGGPQRSIPIATQETFVVTWLPGAIALGLAWLPLAETGFDITMHNCDEVLAELDRLYAWFVSRDERFALERLERAVGELRALRFDEGANVFFG